MVNRLPLEPDDRLFSLDVLFCLASSLDEGLVILSSVDECFVILDDEHKFSFAFLFVAVDAALNFML